MESSASSPCTLHIPSTHLKSWLGTLGPLQRRCSENSCYSVLFGGSWQGEKSLHVQHRCLSSQVSSVSGWLRPWVWSLWLRRTDCSQWAGNSACFWTTSVSWSQILLEVDFHVSISLQLSNPFVLWWAGSPFAVTHISQKCLSSSHFITKSHLV